MSRRQLPTEAFEGSGLESPREGRVEEPRSGMGKLALRQGMESQQLHSPCQQIGEPGNQQDVGRPGQQEAARASVAVDGGLHGSEGRRDALDFVEDDLGSQPSTARRDSDPPNGDAGCGAPSLATWAMDSARFSAVDTRRCSSSESDPISELRPIGRRGEACAGAGCPEGVCDEKPA